MTLSKTKLAILVHKKYPNLKLQYLKEATVKELKYKLKYGGKYGYKVNSGEFMRTVMKAYNNPNYH